MSTANKTPNLSLPQYTGSDKFDLEEINKGYLDIDSAYKEIIDFREEIPKVNASAEIIEARDGEEKLYDKIKKIDSSLEQKANEVDVRKKGTLITMADIGQDIKSALTGGSTAIVGEGAVSKINLASDLMSNLGKNYSYDENPKNNNLDAWFSGGVSVLFYNDFNKILSVSKIYADIVTESSNGYIEVYKGTKKYTNDIQVDKLIGKYTVINGQNVFDCNFDLSTNEAILFLSSSNVQIKYSVSGNDCQTRRWYENSNGVSPSIGSSLTYTKSIEPSWNVSVGIYANYLDMYNIRDIEEKIIQVEDKSNKFSNEINNKLVNKYDLVKQGQNLANPYDCIFGKYVNKNTGDLVTWGNYLTSGYIEVIQGESYFIDCSNNGTDYCLYDKDKIPKPSLWKQITNNIITIPTNEDVKYIRFSNIKDQYANGIKDYDLCFVKSKTVIPLKKYSINFDEVLMPYSALPFSNKNIVIVGDSYTDLGKYFPSLYSITDANYIGDIGISGEPLCRFAYNITQNNILITKADLVIIIGGTNDYGVQGYNQASNNITLGTFSDLSNIRTVEKIISDGNSVLSKSIYIAIKEIINTVSHYNKDVPILFVTQPERGNYAGIEYAPNESPQGLTMWKIAEAIKDCTSKLGCDCYDFHSMAWTYEQRNKYTDDELHPNEIGGERMGKLIGKYINNHY